MKVAYCSNVETLIEVVKMRNCDDTKIEAKKSTWILFFQFFKSNSHFFEMVNSVITGHIMMVASMVISPYLANCQ